MINILFYEPPGFGKKKKAGGSLKSMMHMLKGLDRDVYKPIVALCHNYDCIDEIRGPLNSKTFIIGPTPTGSERGNKKHRKLPLKDTRFKTELKDIRLIYKRRKIVKELVSLIREQNIAMIHCNSKYEWAFEGIIASAICKIPCICHTRSYLGEPSFTKRLLESRVKKHIAISTSIKQELITRGVNLNKIELVHNWLDFKKNNIQLFASKDLSKFKVLSVGRIIPWKGIDILISAASKLEEKHDICFYIFGDYTLQKDYYTHLKKMIMDLGLESVVQFMGHVDNDQIYRGNYNLFVHTATSPEPFGRSIIEAMHYGVPVVASGIGGVLDIIEDGWNGMLCEAGNEEQLAEIIDDLVVNNEKREILARNARTTIECKFTEKANMNKLNSAYRQIIIS